MYQPIRDINFPGNIHVLRQSPPHHAFSLPCSCESPARHCHKILATVLCAAEGRGALEGRGCPLFVVLDSAVPTTSVRPQVPANFFVTSRTCSTTAFPTVNNHFYENKQLNTAALETTLQPPAPLGAKAGGGGGATSIEVMHGHAAAVHSTLSSRWAGNAHTSATQVDVPCTISLAFPTPAPKRTLNNGSCILNASACNATGKSPILGAKCTAKTTTKAADNNNTANSSCSEAIHQRN